MLRMPESPRWLVEKGRDDEALAVLKTVRSEDRAVAEWDQVERVVEEEHEEHWTGLGAILRSKWLIRILLVGIGISMTQQLTGINSIMYYGQRVLIEAGFTASAALIANISPASSPWSAASSRCTTWTGSTGARPSSSVSH